MSFGHYCEEHKDSVFKYGGLSPARSTPSSSNLRVGTRRKTSHQPCSPNSPHAPQVKLFIPWLRNIEIDGLPARDLPRTKGGVVLPQGCPLFALRRRSSAGTKQPRGAIATRSYRYAIIALRFISPPLSHSSPPSPPISSSFIAADYSSQQRSIKFSSCSQDKASGFSILLNLSEYKLHIVFLPSRISTITHTHTDFLTQLLWLKIIIITRHHHHAKLSHFTSLTFFKVPISLHFS